MSKNEIMASSFGRMKKKVSFPFEKSEDNQEWEEKEDEVEQNNVKEEDEKKKKIKDEKMNDKEKSTTAYTGKDDKKMTSLLGTSSVKKMQIDEAPDKNTISDDSWLSSMSTHVFIHILCLALYVYPLVKTHPNHDSVLDELFLESNDDILGSKTLNELVFNDYWGRSMYAHNSHKSWRPFSVMLFRFIRTNNDDFIPTVLFYRIIGLFIHAALAELVSNCACLLFPQTSIKRQMSIRIFTKLLFAFHPTHVETVSNSANRVHILALLFSMLAVDYRIDVVFLPLILFLALTSCETALFQLPAILITMTVAKWRNRADGKTFWSLFATAITLIPQYFATILVMVCYLMIRHYLDAFDIPDGLIRPAENPFYELVGIKRILSYSIVLSIHVGKVFLVDPLGFSHEYGFNCLPAVENGMEDIRLLYPTFCASLLLMLTFYCLKIGLEPTLILIVGLSWLLTLFPVSGVVKVGTFISDRIVVPSTVTFGIFGGVLTTKWLYGSDEPESIANIKNLKKSSNAQVLRLKYLTILGLLSFMGFKVAKRSLEWMSAVSLIQSSLVNCPNSAKSNLEMSKIHSGMYDEMLDLDKSLSFVQKAADIDPNFCDVHQQFAAIYFHKNKLLPFEEHLTKAVLCPFTMGGSKPNFERYWKALISDPRTATAAKKRYMKHMTVIETAIKEAVEKERTENEKKSKVDEKNSLIPDEF